MAKKPKLKYGLMNSKLIHIDEVDKQEKSNYICPSCKRILVPKKGPIKEHHFAHAKNENCEHAYETTLHLLAKSIIQDFKEIVLPKVTLDFHSNTYPRILYPETKTLIDSVYLEQRQGHIIPDVIVKAKDRILLVEIYVTHKINETKKQYIVDSNISCIEINLSGAPRDLDYKSISDIVISQVDKKTWIHNAKAHSQYNYFLNRAIEKPIHWSANKNSYGSECRHLVYDCPIRIKEKEYDTRGDVRWECPYCENCISSSGNSILCYDFS